MFCAIVQVFQTRFHTYSYTNAGQDEELIGKADALYKKRLQKGWCIVWDIGTFALNQKMVKDGKFNTY